MIAYIVDQIPLWFYIVVAVFGVGALFYLFSPILVPLWNVTPKWVKLLLGAIGAIFAAFIYGLNKGNRDAKALRDKQNAQAVSQRKEIDREVTNLSEPAADKRLDRWMRD